MTCNVFGWTLYLTLHSTLNIAATQCGAYAIKFKYFRHAISNNEDDKDGLHEACGLFTCANIAFDSVCGS